MERASSKIEQGSGISDYTPNGRNEITRSEQYNIRVGYISLILSDNVFISKYRLMNMNHNKYNQPEYLKQAIMKGLSAVMKADPQGIANSIYGLSEMQWTWKDLILQQTQKQLIGMIILNERRFNMQVIDNRF